MNMRESIFQLGYSLFVDTFKGVFKNQDKPQSDIPETMPRTECRGCTVHTEVGQAYLYLLGISQRVDDNQEVPKGIAGTLLLARAHVRRAYMEASSMMYVDPEIDEHATKLVTILPDIDHRLEFVANGREVKQITVLCKEAWEIAYCIPEIIYRPEEPKSEITQLRAQVEELKQQIDSKLSEEAQHADRPGMGGHEEESRATRVEA